MKRHMKRWACGILAAYWLASCSLLMAETYYVATNGVDTRTGTLDWTNAVLTISNAVAKATTAGDLVWVSNGVYVVSTQVNLTAGITVRGWSANRADVVVDGANATRCFNINNSAALLAGLTVMRGTNSSIGGGILVGSSGGTISNCVIADCVGLAGGGVYMGANARLTHSAILGNRATDSGSGLAGGGLKGKGANIIITNCVIASNSAPEASSGGGGICLESCENCLITDSTINSNYTVYRGGGINMYQGRSTISRCVISNNLAVSDGSGIYIWTGSTGMAENCHIVNNGATAATGSGGGAYMTGAYMLRNCLIQNNSIRNISSRYGGGVHIAGAGSTVDTCTVVGNLNTYAGNGGGIYTTTSAVTIINSVVWSNAGGDVAIAAAGGPLALSYCCVSNANTFGGTGNITNDPAFVSAGPGNNWRLSNGSPGVNMGVNETWMDDALDLDGKRRIDRFGQRVDMGAYELLLEGTLFSIR